MRIAERWRVSREKSRRARIDAVCGGWSGDAHWRFFHDEVARLAVRDVCVLGVYLGRDIAYLRDAFHAARRDDVRIVGVDLFADVPGADWPEAQRHLSWEQAGFGPAPALAAAHANLVELGLDAGVTLHQADAMDFLARHPRAFDLVFIDIAHDYDTTRAAIGAARASLRPGGILCGDDYSDQGTWGVKRAVDEACTDKRVFSNWIWLARAQDVRPRLAGDPPPVTVRVPVA